MEPAVEGKYCSGVEEFLDFCLRQIFETRVDTTRRATRAPSPPFLNLSLVFCLQFWSVAALPVRDRTPPVSSERSSQLPGEAWAAAVSRAG